MRVSFLLLTKLVKFLLIKLEEIVIVTVSLGDKVEIYC